MFIGMLGGVWRALTLAAGMSLLIPGTAFDIAGAVLAIIVIVAKIFVLTPEEAEVEA